MTLPNLHPELTFRAVRGSGPGGQHVNKVATKVELRWNLKETNAFTDVKKQQLLDKLGGELNSEGELILTDQSSRSQHTNRERVTRRFYALLEKSLRRDKPRKKTRPTLASKRKRLRNKRNRSEVKSGRGRWKE